MKFVIEKERFSTVVGKSDSLSRDKSPLEVIKPRYFKSKITLGVRYTPCDREGLIFNSLYSAINGNETFMWIPTRDWGFEH